ncbi:NuoI/complex I 23 kDa subunit family protein [Heliorestis convoluta]|uniref:Proton-translocating NADH-ubiquinone oxidoreductase, 23 kd, chain i n=1 Tax=Heliorestis convoluta TaxID=356322 RepID=A0A5Q2MZF2_9FIRM|nr:NADH-quinone oxidoreductase subunit I [Heliorestis convoluta]QGG48148.1 Proton-translocating NADH-ubiquinone oxidoreductase, 23 kd, chain i [Heliorestis convoluta]
MLGKGLLTGMAVTLREMFRKNVTEEYPEVQPDLGERFRGGRLELNVSKCIACGLCMTNCPNGSIKLTTVKDENNKRQLNTYVHNTGLCLFCNLCIEACPPKCIEWSKEFAYSGYSRDALIFDCMALDKQQSAEDKSQTTEEKG